MLGSVVDHSLWGVPEWLKDSIRALGAQGMPSPALPSSGRSLGEEQSLAVLPVPGSTWAARGLGPCPCHRAKPGSADVGEGHLRAGHWAKAGGEAASIPKAASLGNGAFGGAGWLCCTLAVLE